MCTGCASPSKVHLHAQDATNAFLKSPPSHACFHHSKEKQSVDTSPPRSATTKPIQAHHALKTSPPVLRIQSQPAPCQGCVLSSQGSALRPVGGPALRCAALPTVVHAEAAGAVLEAGGVAVGGAAVGAVGAGTARGDKEGGG